MQQLTFQITWRSGFWGVIAVGLFSEPDLVWQLTGNTKHYGFFYSLAKGHSDAHLLACQAMGAFFIFGWTLITMLPFFLFLNAMNWLRTEAVEEIVGLDLAYNEGQKFENSEQDGGLRDEFLVAFEESKLKHKSMKRLGRGGSDANSMRSSGRSAGSSERSYR